MHHLTVIEDPRVKECIENCSSCGDICAEAVSHCLRMGGDYSSPELITLMLDCVHICRTSADVMLRGSEFGGQLCQLCAEIVDRCAAACERFGSDEHMRACTQACRKCADSCREMAAI